MDWIIYSKEYTEEHIGGEINRKMDLIDIFTAFSQTKPACDEEKQCQEGKVIKYQFGTIVQSQKLPCYKIEREGRVTVYMNMIDAKTKKQITHDSKLKLNKDRPMTET